MNTDLGTTSYAGTNLLKRVGARGGIRVDYEVYAGGKVARVFDLKLNDLVGPRWLSKAGRYMSLGPNDFEAIAYELDE